MLAGTAQAGAFLSMDPGESQTRDFILWDQFQAARLGPMETFILMGSGSDTTPMGNLTITIKPTVTKYFGAVVEYSLIGLAYPLADFASLFGGTPVVINVKTSAPLSLTKAVTMNAKYGIALLGIFIKKITGDVDLPVQFNITFAWAAGTAAEAE
jgi:hypothetical protein